MRRKCPRAGILLLLTGFIARVLPPPTLFAAENVAAQSRNPLAQSMLERAQAEVAKIRPLVEDGTLPKSRLEAAQTALADAEDEVILSDTLYGNIRVQDMTAEQATNMVAAAQRRLERESALLEQKRKFVSMGVLAPAEIRDFEEEVASRKLVLDLAQNRAKLLDDLRQMAETEQRLEEASRRELAASSFANVMVRYDGNGLFGLSDLPPISSQFERQFHHALPVSAKGQTLLHRSMGLDHRNRVDVALNPDGTEGVWLRHLLEKMHVPYLAFRSAVAGAATAPHIHIGTGSTRLAMSKSGSKPRV